MRVVFLPPPPLFGSLSSRMDILVSMKQPISTPPRADGIGTSIRHLAALVKRKREKSCDVYACDSVANRIILGGMRF